jgi:hypothetical protein
MRKLKTSTDLAWALEQPSGFLVNYNSNVESKQHVVHRLPLQPRCQGNRMGITSQYPKVYVADRQELESLNLGVRGRDWDDCVYC